MGLGGLSLIDRARALCAAADDVQRATIEASRRIAAIHGSPKRPQKKKKATAPAKEPPDICARPPSDVPPPRGEGWRRLGPVSVVSGSNRVSAPPQTSRRALTRDVEVFVDGGCYSVVPADIDPGGGFCVSLDRDFAGETNMACMLYIRKKMKGGAKKAHACHAKTSSAGHKNAVVSEGAQEPEIPCVDALARRKVGGCTKEFRKSLVGFVVVVHMYHLGLGSDSYVGQNQIPDDDTLLSLTWLLNAPIILRYRLKM